MGVFSAIVLSEAPIMRAGEAQLFGSQAVGAQLVGDQQLRREAVFAEQLAHQPECRMWISPTLNEDIEDLALVVDGAPWGHPLPSDPDGLSVTSNFGAKPCFLSSLRISRSAACVSRRR